MKLGQSGNNPWEPNQMTIHLHQYDIPKNLSVSDFVALDTETTGLNVKRDRLCLVQLSAGNGDAHLIHFPTPRYDAPHLKQRLADRAVVKLFHFARFDVAVLFERLNVWCTPIYCTKIASKLVRTYTDRHSLKELCQDLLGLELSKTQQSSDWGAKILTAKQQNYAAADVCHLHQLREKLDLMLEREGRKDLAQECFSFLPTRVRLDLAGWGSEDIFTH